MNTQSFKVVQAGDATSGETGRDPLTGICRRSMFWTPEREAPSAWIEHVPFAFWLVDVLRPRRIVELGTHNGVSYSAMCQAVKTLGLATSCFAVDAWKGDEHAGFYGEDVYRDFAAFHDPRYGAFSVLVRSTFDEALRHFEDGSIDLLHIDGFHSYEAVRHDYESWLPKLSSNAVVLLHDINVRERGFGVYRLWSEISAGKPHFSFLHGHGLGVLGHGQDGAAALRALFDANEDSRSGTMIRETFSTLGRSIRIVSERPGLERSLSEGRAEIDTLRQTLAARDGELAHAKRRLSENATEANTLKQTLATREGELARIRQRLGEVNMLKQALAAREGDLASLRRQLSERGLRWSVRHPRKALYLMLNGGHSVATRSTLARRPNKSPFGVKLRAALRHPLNAAKRKAYRSNNKAILPAAANHIRLGLNSQNWQDSYRELCAFSQQVQQDKIFGFKPKPFPTIVLSEEEAIARARTLAFSPSQKPKASIVIPVYGKFRLTIECLCSLLKVKNAVPFEVIIVDDGSTEDSCEGLAHISGVKYIRNKANVGFVKTCNRGIEHAVGEYIVVLNNDVQLTDFWLDQLIAAIESEPDIGAVGPKIIYPNGRLQEAGVVINRDGTSTLIGVGERGDFPAYNYRREVDYCSGACLVFKKALFKELGGFDLEFVPSYCEDVDLCLKIRQRGLKIVYVPESVIVHHLSATANAIHKSYKGWMVVRNQQKLAERRQEQIDRLNEVRLIAFYLPQFHPIPENDRWWGKGFTEWSNVAKARPNFVGHQQPILPADLGFYDLRLSETMVAQAELAQRYGIYGFCFYYYWFDGKRLLEAPLERMLATGKPDIPFCLCWANENWTRRWDGRNSDILMKQNHTEADDCAVIEDVSRYMRHPNYIRIQGKPVFAVYRVGEFPDAATTASRWRQRCRDNGVGEIFLLSVESLDAAFRNVDPRSFGFDAAMEFPPHSGGERIETPPLINELFQGQVFDYIQMAKMFIQRTVPSYPLFRCVTPRWDNTARKQDHSDVFIGANPGAYQAWLQAMIQQTRLMHHGDSQLVFVNAWNEWAEGAHLEPDRIFGHSYLQATRDAFDAEVLAAVKES